MPVIASIKCGCEFTRRRDIGIAVKHMTDLIRIFLLDARQRQLRESLCGMNLELWSNAVSSDADQWSQEESEEKKSRHRARILRLRSTGCQPVNVSPTRTFALVAETFRAWVGLPAAGAFVRRVSAVAFNHVACTSDILNMYHSLSIAGLLRILAILSAMQITSVSLNAEKPSAKSSPSPSAADDNPLLVESTLPYHAPP